MSKEAKPSKALKIPKDVAHAYQKFAADFLPFEAKEGGTLHIFTDYKSGARFCECHVLASKLVPAATTDVPLDPEDSPDYRANRELVTDATAFARMKEDALAGRVLVILLPNIQASSILSIQ